MIVYAYQKANIFLLKQDSKITSYVSEMHFDDHFSFGNEQGLQIAIALTGFNNEREWELDPSVGKFMFAVNEWGFD